eukprot:39469-Eustigmatos_ZCMA.PRE.1
MLPMTRRPALRCVQVHCRRQRARPKYDIPADVPLDVSAWDGYGAGGGPGVRTTLSETDRTGELRGEASGSGCCGTPIIM